MLDLAFINRIPQHEESNDQTKKEFHLKNPK